MNILGLAPFVWEEERGFIKFRASTFMSVYSAAMLVIVLLGEILMMTGQDGRENMDNVYAFASMMKSSACIVSFYVIIYMKVISALLL